VDDRRRFERTATAIRVEINHPSFGTIVGFTSDISDGGAQVKIESETIPPLGTEVSVIFKKVVGAINVEPVKMKVMHSRRSTVGLMFMAS